jgi:hypothetical protein
MSPLLSCVQGHLVVPGCHHGRERWTLRQGEKEREQCHSSASELQIRGASMSPTQDSEVLGLPVSQDPLSSDCDRTHWTISRAKGHCCNR